jgi:hypothetical protein
MPAQSVLRASRTAISLGVPVLTQDDDYIEVPGLAVVHV